MRIVKSVSLRREQIAVGLLILTAIYVELYPGHLPGRNTVGQEFSAIKSVIESTPEAAVLMTRNTILRDLRSVNAPLANTYDSTWERIYFPIAAQGESAFANFLEQNKVKYVLALQSERGVPIFEGSIQDYALFSIELSADRFELIDKPVRSLLDTSRVIQLLKVKPGNSALRYSDPCINTDLRFYPQTQIDPGSSLEISDDIWWILSDRQVIFPNFFGSQRCEEGAFIHMDLVPALGPWATIQEVEVQTKFTRQVITLIPGETFTISIPIEYGPIEMTSKKECFIPSNNIPNNTDNRSLCFGVKRLWIGTSK
jgi:hypothetical protein